MWVVGMILAPLVRWPWIFAGRGRGTRVEVRGIRRGFNNHINYSKTQFIKNFITPYVYYPAIPQGGNTEGAPRWGAIQEGGKKSCLLFQRNTNGLLVSERGGDRG
jgi:hypothetical protein